MMILSATGTVLKREPESDTIQSIQGIGKRLYEYVIAYAREQKFYNVTLNAWALNEGAMKFYEACGLVPQKVGMEKIL